MEEDKKRHGVECGVVKELPGIAAMHGVDYTLLRLVLNVVGRRALERGGGEVGEGSVPVGFLEDLETHEEGQGVEWRRCVLNAAKDLASQLPETLKTDPADLLRIACRINVNSHVITDPTSTGSTTRNIAVGLFPLTAILNHSCRPNSTYVTSGEGGGTMMLRTLVPVGEGEELTLSYVDLYASRLDRRKKLAETKFFSCQCDRCDADAETEADQRIDGILCDSCVDGERLFVRRHPTSQERHCQSCKKILEDPTPHLQRIENTFSLVFAFANAGKIDSVLCAFKHHRSKILTGSTTPRLHPHHKLLITPLSTLISYAKSENDWEDALEFATDLVEAMEGCLPPNWPEVADFVYGLAEVQEIVGRAFLEGGEEGGKRWKRGRVLLREVERNFGRCLEMRRVAFGEGHPRTLDALEQIQRVKARGVLID
ncbi:hypothetical protein HDU67_007812 [Dinochytrium kinnereticum]|nr:hypothetical protein HDU67_007812 [Dinochytrium kinnereticum]